VQRGKARMAVPSKLHSRYPENPTSTTNAHINFRDLEPNDHELNCELNSPASKAMGPIQEPTRVGDALDEILGDRLYTHKHDKYYEERGSNDRDREHHQRSRRRRDSSDRRDQNLPRRSGHASLGYATASGRHSTIPEVSFKERVALARTNLEIMCEMMENGQKEKLIGK
jgi:hypothetical protein